MCIRDRWEAVIAVTDGSRKYKKTRVRYFADDFAAWNCAHGLEPVTVSA